MMVLKIIGLIIVLVIVYTLYDKFETHIYTKYKYRIIDEGNMTLILLGYGLSYFGYYLYNKAVLTQGDILNGIIVFSIGAIIILIHIFKNIKNTGFFKGIMCTLVQIVVGALFAVFSIISIAIMLMIAAETKPVFNLNSK